MHYYRLHGVAVASELELPELDPDPHAAATVTVRWGNVPALLPDATARVGGLQVSGNRLLFTLESVARYLIEDGNRITIDKAPDADLETVRVFLLGTVWAACCHQRGLLLMHASVARIGSVTVAFVGASGAGKSTLSALLAARGHTIASDDTCVFTLDPAGLAWIVPSYPRLKLWSDALEILPAAAASAQPAAMQPGKFKLQMREHWCAQPLVLDHILELADDRSGATPGFASLAAVEVVQVLVRNTFRPRLLRLQGRQADNFRACAAVAQSVRVHRWTRPWNAPRPELIHILEQWLTGATAALQLVR